MPDADPNQEAARQMAETLPDNAAPESPSGKDADHIPPPQPGWPAILGYGILRELSHGGQGIVYQAVQKSTQREVAIKVLLEGPYASESARRRFEREVELVSHLKHPNIIVVFDSGIAPDGRLYYVMDYVRGVPLMEYVRATKPTMEQALVLFASICDAVNHAHQNGVIHRDLKPSNILIDSEGNLQLLDFGLARAITERPETMVTVTGQVMGTLPYMSPEQARGSPELLDIRTDVYALGVILYEMLTGAYPYPVVGEMAEVLKHIVHTEPKSPTRSWTKDAGVGRPTGVRGRAKCPINNEVETIVLKALAKERERRYQGAGELAKDVRHYLANEPIEAKRDSGLYLLRKTLARHRMGVGAAAAIVAVLAGSAVIFWLQRNEARRARAAAEVARAEARSSEAEAKAVLEFFQDKVLAAARPEGQEGGLGREVTIRAAVDAAEPLIATSFADRPGVEASIRQALGQTYMYLGEYAAALRQTERALFLNRTRLGPDHPQTLNSMSDLGGIYLAIGRVQEALALVEETLKSMKTKLGPDRPETLTLMNNLASAYQSAGRLREALPLFEETLKLQKAKLGPDHPATLNSMRNLAVAYMSVGRRQEALPLCEETFKLMRAKLGPDHPDTLNAMGSLASAYDSCGRLQEAVALNEETLKLQKAKLGPDHPDTLTTINNLAGTYVSAGRRQEALPLYEETLKLLKAKRGPDHPYTLNAMGSLAVVYQDSGRLQEALPLYEETLRLQKAKLGPDYPDTLQTMRNLASAYMSAGRRQEALPLCEETFKLSKSRLGPDHPNTLISMNNLARTYLSAGRLQEALPLFEETLRLGKAKLGPDHPNTLISMNHLASAYMASGLFSNAAELYEQGMEASPTNHFFRFQYACLLAQVGDRDRYRDHCNAMLKQFADTQDQSVADRTAKASLFVANSGVDLTIAAQLADRAVSGGDQWWMYWFQICKGLAEYRLGRYQSAGDWLARSVGTTRGSSVKHAFVEGALGLAMTKFRLGQAGEAKALLAEAIPVLDSLPKPGEMGFEDNFPDWIIGQTLRREAEGLIRGAPTTGPATQPAQ